jgi:regulator of cell morphogenesis and NO signaling
MTHAGLIALSMLIVALAGCAATPEPHVCSGAVGVDTEPAQPAWNDQTPIGRIVTEQPETARIFDLIGIDYCCGGDTPLGEAATERNLNVNRLLGALAVVGGEPANEHVRNWDHASVDELIDHIVDVYHAELRIVLPRLDEVIATVVEVHRDEHPELVDVQRVFRALRTEMEEHLALEEDHAFPAIRRLAAGKPVDDVQTVIDVLYDDHDEAAEALQTLHTLTNGYTPPTGACNLYRQMLTGLDRLEQQTMAHIHLENNVLFPRARAALTQ